MEKGNALNHIGSHPTGRTWQTPIYKNDNLIFIAIGSTQEESAENAKIIIETLKITKLDNFVK